jgi:hypothetical protein
VSAPALRIIAALEANGRMTRWELASVANVRPGRLDGILASATELDGRLYEGDAPSCGQPGSRARVTYYGLLDA